ncbi:hypothetical protein A2634_03200 [Candidatus Amesbacteria bacterium RIFCSPHIGHO2_01_FULL_48_32]|uniref:Gluconeogenesis factor n=1 Tax=Candidatus Amesbacteria bacterium RIFCSPLOWO2_01_FULL_48_25 TaxID=1797259 RepID=A0A1F4ZDT6_9BACT|nr:MAG: hypothetical protein A2634_03200 [Candidatus Amesbacteria bacterium RIFCSPHIGHO2_01_FULL_48_32]OGD03584.1 MAG: hypothetical protein A2989_02790 [Candidatus Amesbacteria bacterium RIFCSPLOWO2_01_FULL_48_25]HJZ04684.1 2-phospho-L-lactate transferase CofD family protein [Patescibacteria group bacterium]
MKSQPRIVTIGGGTGAPTVVRALTLAGFNNINAISASMDSGGKTGTIRSDERDQVIAVSDLMRNLLALISPSYQNLPQIQAFTDLVTYTDGRNRNLGYTLYYALLEKYSGDFLQVQKHLENLLSLKFSGAAIPITLSPTTICFSTISGSEFRGEHELDRHSMSTDSIFSIWLNPQVPATPQALTALTDATHIIFCPGSIYGSVIANLLPKGISLALKKSRAHKILITNLVSTRNQTHKFSPIDFQKVFQTYSRTPSPFDTIIVPHLSESQFEAKYPKVAQNYSHEHSHFLGWNPGLLTPLKKSDVLVISAPIFSVTSHLNRIRHDPHLLAPILKKLINHI